jgi:hypothetical protein
MDVTRSTGAAAAKPAQLPENEVRSDARTDVRTDLRNSVRNAAAATPKTAGYGMPCVNCRLYYPADVDHCPACNGTERISPNAVPSAPKALAVVEALPDNAVLEQEREAFLKEFKSQLFAAHAEVASASTVCALEENHAQGAEGATICKPCYDRIQERVDVCEAALHIDLKEAAQIIYDAVWADPSDPSKTYTNAASALLGELRRRSGVSSMISPFQPLGN